MRVYQNYAKAQASGEQRSYKPLPPGGYVLKILRCEEMPTKSGRTMLRFAFDIAEGEHAGFFANEYKNDTRPDKKWSNGGYFYLVEPEHTNVPADDPTLRRMKGVFKAIEDSNKGFVFNMDERTLNNKLVGGLFRREAYVGRDGNEHWGTKCMTFCSADRIRSGDFTVPADKPVDGGSAPTQTVAPTQVRSDGFIPVDNSISADPDLPF